MKRFRSWVSILLTLTFLFPLFPLPEAKAADAEPQKIGEVNIDASYIVGDLDKHYLSNYTKIMSTAAQPYSVAGRVTKMELQSEDGTWKKDIPFTDTTYTIGQIDPIERVEVNASYESWPGYFAWFRGVDNKKIWMYDLYNKRNYRLTDQVYERPPTSCYAIDRPSSTKGTKLDNTCNEAWFGVSGTASKAVLETKIAGEDIEIPASKVDQLHIVDGGIAPIEVGKLYAPLIRVATTKDDEPGNKRSPTIDNQTLKYSFQAFVKFSVPYDEVEPSGGTNKWVIKWRNQFSIPLKGYVYKYHKLKVVAYVEPLEKPDVKVTSLTTNKSCFTVGESATFTYTLANGGADTTKSFNVQISAEGATLATHAIQGGMVKEGTKSGTFLYTFTSTAPMSLTVAADPPNTIGEDSSTLGNNVMTKTFRAQAKCGDTPDPGEDITRLTGKVRMDKAYIPWKSTNVVIIDSLDASATFKGEKFRFVMTDSEGHTYASEPTVGLYNITRSGSNGLGTAPFIWNSATKSYPGNIQPGVVEVTAQIRDTSGTWIDIGDTNFTIGDAPPNNPPYLDLIWVNMDAPNTQIDWAVAGDKVGLKIKEMKDEDGDPITLSWDFTDSTEWVAGIPDAIGAIKPYTKRQYLNIPTSYKQLKNEVCATATDDRGASFTDCERLDIHNPNPVPIITGGTMVKEGRVLKPALSSEQSFPRVKGRTIDHSRDSWTNKQDMYTVVGEETVTLHVFDNTGLQSEEPAVHLIQVLEDKPPVAQMEVQPLMVRGSPVMFRNSSHSIDGDEIETYRVTYGYDARNDGSCDPTATFASSTNTAFEFNPQQVGKYCFNVFVQEAEGYKKSDERTYTVDVINLAPEVAFTATGTNIEPMPVIQHPIAAAQLLGEEWKAHSFKQWQTFPKEWRAAPNNGIRSGFTAPWKTGDFTLLGKTYGHTLPQDFGEAELLWTLPSRYNGREYELSYYLGNQTFIGESRYSGGGGYEYVLIVPNQEPISIDGFAPIHDGSANFYIRDDLNEVIFVKRYFGHNGVYNYRYDEVAMTKYRLSDLQNGTVSKVATGSITYRHSLNRPNSSDNKWEYAPIAFQDGSMPWDESRVSFNEGWYSVHLTTHTINKYKNQHDSVPYEQISIDPYFSDMYRWNTPNITYPALKQRGAAPDGEIGGGLFSDVWGNWYMVSHIGNQLQLSRIRYADAQIEHVATLTYLSSSSAPEKILRESLQLNQTRNVLRVGTAYKGYQYVNLATKEVTGAQPSGKNADYNGITVANYFKEKDIYNPQMLGIEQANSYRNLYVVNKPSGRRTGSCAALDTGSFGDEKTVYIVEDGLAVIGKPGSWKLVRLPHTDPDDPPTDGLNYGQLLNDAHQQMADMNIVYQLRFTEDIGDVVPAGMTFRAQPNGGPWQELLSAYRLEASENRLQLVKIINSTKTKLATYQRKMQKHTWYDYKIRLNGDRIRVYENGVPVFDVRDAALAKGRFGPFATSGGVEFKGIAWQEQNEGIEHNAGFYAVVDTDIDYTHTFMDAETDPRYEQGVQWSYTQLNDGGFLNAGDGKSGLSSFHGQVKLGPVPSLDKVGVYEIQYQAPDDPHRIYTLNGGNTEFAVYSQYSDPYKQQITIHRAPIARFTLALQAEGTIAWNDQSYDPDRCYADAAGHITSCQSGYADNHGIANRKYYYVSPDGEATEGKLIRPTQSGAYTVHMAVRDEYGAWSSWYSQSIQVTKPLENNPPTVELTFPSGSKTQPSKVGITPTLTWNQSDPDPHTVYTVARVKITDEQGTELPILGGSIEMNTTATSYSWRLINPLQYGGLYSVSVQVIDDSGNTSPWSNIGWMKVISPPSAVMTVPNGTYMAPTELTTRRPTLSWEQTDRDENTVYTHFHMEVYEEGEAGETLVHTSGKAWQGSASNTGSYALPVELPIQTLLKVRIKVWDDDGLESEWSPYTWMYIDPNKPPQAKMIVPDGTQAAPTMMNTLRPELQWEQTDPDAGEIFSAYQLQITNEANTETLLDSGKQAQWTSEPTGKWTVTEDLPAGVNLRVRVKVWDRQGAESPWSAQTWMRINRPPVADFTWTPNPAFEGDAITLVNKSTDPDKEVLTAAWTIVIPEGATWSSTETEAAIAAAATTGQPGEWEVTLRVTDPWGESDAVTKLVPVGDLTIKGAVYHTENWETYRQTYNLEKSGETDKPRGPELFWAGEAFETEGRTNEPAVKVQVHMSQRNITAAMTGKEDRKTWTKRVHESGFENLPDGAYTFTFTAWWANGHMETDEVTVQIDGVWLDYTRSVRKE